MAKLTGPLLSFGADGQIGKAMVTAKWRGISYARQYTIPANPRTTAQQANRSRFAFFRNVWKLAPAEVRNAFDAFATGRKFLGFNAFVGQNNKNAQGVDNLQAMLMSPSARGGLPPAGVIATTGAATGEVLISVTPPTQLPDGWTVIECAGAALVDQEPVGEFVGNFVAATDDTDPFEITLSGFEPSEPVVGFGWVIYQKPTGERAYSVSVADTTIAAA